MTHEILPQLVYSLSQQNRFYKKAAAFVLRAVSKHSPQLAQAVVESGTYGKRCKLLLEGEKGWEVTDIHVSFGDVSGLILLDTS